MKPNNLVALLVVAILLAIGIALAVINKRETDKTPPAASEESSTSLIVPAINSIKKGASHYS